VREFGTIVGGEEWQEKVYNREEWKKLLRMARNCHILHMPMERMNEKKERNIYCCASLQPSCNLFCIRQQTMCKPYST
jgi:hypothetical protein